jgi:AraC-like DNA-binding protein
MELADTFSLSASKLAVLFEYLDKQGISKNEFLAGIGLDHAITEQPDRRIPLDNLETIFSRAYETTGDRHFGLHYGEMIQKGPANILNYIMMNCWTIEEVLKKYCRYEIIQDDISKTDYRCDGGTCYVSIVIRYGSPFFKQQYLESKCASMVYYAKQLSGIDLALKEVRLTHEPFGDFAEYTRIFRCPVRFGCEENLIILPQSDLAIRVREPNRDLLLFFEKHAKDLQSQLCRQNTFSAKVGRCIIQNIPGIIPAIDEIAGRLEMSVRSLQLKLKEEGSSYRSIVDSVRMDMAINFLRDRAMSIADIAFVLGFSEPSVFHRNFKRWTTSTPAQYRAEVLNHGNQPATE